MKHLYTSSHLIRARAPVWILLVALLSQLWPVSIASAAEGCEMMNSQSHDSQMMSHHDMMGETDSDTQNTAQECCDGGCECRVSLCFSHVFIGSQTSEQTVLVQHQHQFGFNRSLSPATPNLPFRPPINA